MVHFSSRPFSNGTFFKGTLQHSVRRGIPCRSRINTIISILFRRDEQIDSDEHSSGSFQIEQTSFKISMQR